MKKRIPLLVLCAGAVAACSDTSFPDREFHQALETARQDAQVAVYQCQQSQCDALTIPSSAPIDYALLNSFNHLKHLSIEPTRFSDLSNLSGLTKLETIAIYTPAGADLSVLDGFPSLQQVVLLQPSDPDTLAAHTRWQSRSGVKIEYIDLVFPN